VHEFNGKLVVVHGFESSAELRGGSDELEQWAVENLPEGIYCVRFVPIVPGVSSDPDPEGGGA